jgi:hypothetical protein
MISLSKTDLNFVLSRCPKDVTKLLRDNPGKLILAGGFIRNVIAGFPASDVDLFGTSKEFLESIAKDLTIQRKGRMFQTKNAITVLSSARIPVQFITRWLFEYPEQVVASFDFTTCQAVIWAQSKGTGPVYFESAVADNFYSDLAARRLVYTSPDRDEEAGGSMLRVMKFVKKGYNIQADSLAAVIGRIVRKIDFNKLPKGYVDAGLEMVICGLLREVDPLVVVDGVDLLNEHEMVFEDEAK